ncbi:MAG: glycosyltransferase family 2 protein [Planctomycetota bacterium]|jgi:cellulose synthase/poly-beta-1,6-N-acetylglucosamine synthase-like glycosyltransferase
MEIYFVSSFFISLAIIVYVYVGYPCLLVILNFVIVRKKKGLVEGRVEPFVTLIISAFNEEKCIKEKIENSLLIDYPNGKFEVIVVSDASTDDTDKIVRQFENRGVCLVRQENQHGKTTGLNLAMPKANGELIVFSDANAMYQKNAIRKMVKHFNDDRIGYVVGEARYRDANHTVASKSENIYWQYEIKLKKMESRIHSVVGGDGAIYAIRRELYEELLTTDINDFVNPLQIIAKGFRGIYEPGAICWENTAGSFTKEFERKVRIVNRSFSGLLRMRSVLNPFKTGLFSLEILSHKLLRWMVPYFLIIMLVSLLGIFVYNTKTLQWGATPLILFVWCAYIGYLFADDYKVWPIFYYPYYFLAMNIASLIGVFRSLRGNIQTTWVSSRVDGKRIFDSRKISIHITIFIISWFFVQFIGGWLGIHLLAEKITFGISALIICFVYFGYPILLMFLSKYAGKLICRKEITPDVTMLVCAYNEEDVIAEKIENSLALDYPTDKIKIVIASDGSTDRTNNIVRQYNCERLVFMDYPERCGKVGVINKTVPKLTSEIIIFTDANTMYRRDSIRKLVRNFADPSVGGVSADVIIQNKRTDFGKTESMYYKYERWIQKNESGYASVVGADGGMYAIRRKLFVPPSSNIILDDFVISMNIAIHGNRMVYDEDAIGDEESTISSKTEFLRKSRVVAGAIQSILQNEGTPSTSDKKLFFCYFSHKFLRWMVPLFLIAFFITNLRLGLLSKETFYSYLMVTQVLFYLLAFCGFVLSKVTEVSLISAPFYFCLVNGAALYGIYKGLLNKQPVKWQKFSRGDEN